MTKEHLSRRRCTTATSSLMHFTTNLRRPWKADFAYNRAPLPRMRHRLVNQAKCRPCSAHRRLYRNSNGTLRINCPRRSLNSATTVSSTSTSMTRLVKDMRPPSAISIKLCQCDRGYRRCPDRSLAAAAASAARASKLPLLPAIKTKTRLLVGATHDKARAKIMSGIVNGRSPLTQRHR